MPNSELCTEADVQQLVHVFYAKVRSDTLLAPVFDAHVGNWEQHLAQLVNFWSSALRGTARFRGNPLAKHVALPGLTSELFQRWLSLFRETTQSLTNTGLQVRANELAHRIATSFWRAYQVQHGCELVPVDTNHG
ncbi:MAG: group III truncated hemoglobin [Nitrosospira sp.]